LRQRDAEARSAADVAAVRVRELEAAVAAMQRLGDAPEAELRSQAAAVRGVGRGV